MARTVSRLRCPPADRTSSPTQQCTGTNTTQPELVVSGAYARTAGNKTEKLKKMKFFFGTAQVVATGRLGPYGPPTIASDQDQSLKIKSKDINL